MEKQVGTVSHVFNKINVGVLDVTGDSLKVGDTIHVVGIGTDFTQTVSSLEMDHHKVEVVNPGESVGLKFDQPISEKDIVYRLVEE